MKNATPRILGIAGGTASGKSTLAKTIQKDSRFGSVSIIGIDSYYTDQADKRMEERLQVNYDHPSAYEFSPLILHLSALQTGNSVKIPTYDYAAHTRAAATSVINPTPIVIVEGILCLYPPELVQLYALKVFVDAPNQTRLERRIERDVRERGRSRESVLERWDNAAQPMYEQFCLPTRERADLLLDGTRPAEELAGLVLAALQSAPIPR